MLYRVRKDISLARVKDFHKLLFNSIRASEGNGRKFLSGSFALERGKSSRETGLLVDKVRGSQLGCLRIECSREKWTGLDNRRRGGKLKGAEICRYLVMTQLTRESGATPRHTENPDP